MPLLSVDVNAVFNWLTAMAVEGIVPAAVAFLAFRFRKRLAGAGMFTFRTALAAVGTLVIGLTLSGAISSQEMLQNRLENLASLQLVCIC